LLVNALHQRLLQWFASGEYDRAVAFYEESLAIAQAIGSPSWPASMKNRLGEVAQAQGEYARSGAPWQSGLCGGAWNEGHAMPLEQAIAYALDEDRAIPSSNRSR
jgi:hypothetical protein